MKRTMMQTTLMFLGLLLTTENAVAQAVSSLTLSLENLQQSMVQNDQVQRLDLMTEAKRQNPALQNAFDLSRVEIMLKSGIGGAAVYLNVNGQMVDSSSIETNPDLFDRNGGEGKVELKNIERRVDSAVLQIIGRAKIASVKIFFGAISEPALVGSYVNAEAMRIARMARPEREPVVAVRPPEHLRPGAQVNPPNISRERDGTPSIMEPEPNIWGRGRDQDRRVSELDEDYDDDSYRRRDPWGDVRPPARRPQPRVVRQPPRQAYIPPVAQDIRPRAQTQPQAPRNSWRSLNCVSEICVGARVENSFGFRGVVVRAFPDRGLLEVKFEFQTQTLLRPASQLRTI